MKSRPGLARAMSTVAHSRRVPWLRPNDLVWNYVVNNYLLGKDPPAFDILSWNQDNVDLAAGLHRDFVRTALDNGLAHPGATEVLGTPIDLNEITQHSYAIAVFNDHIVPWENAYRSAQLLGGAKRLVLSTSDHIQALVSPPRPETRPSYRVTTTRRKSPRHGPRTPTSAAAAGGPTPATG
jgi:polyhydroxyalkanoate synthase